MGEGGRGQQQRGRYRLRAVRRRRGCRRRGSSLGWRRGRSMVPACSSASRVRRRATGSPAQRCAEQPQPHYFSARPQPPHDHLQRFPTAFACAVHRLTTDHIVPLSGWPQCDLAGLHELNACVPLQRHMGCTTCQGSLGTDQASEAPPADLVNPQTPPCPLSWLSSAFRPPARPCAHPHSCIQY